MLDQNIIDAALYEIETESLHLKTIASIITGSKTDYLDVRELQELYGDILHKAERISEATERMRDMFTEVPQ